LLHQHRDGLDIIHWSPSRTEGRPGPTEDLLRCRCPDCQGAFYGGVLCLERTDKVDSYARAGSFAAFDLNHTVLAEQSHVIRPRFLRGSRLPNEGTIRLSQPGWHGGCSCRARISGCSPSMASTTRRCARSKDRSRLGSAVASALSSS